MYEWRSKVSQRLFCKHCGIHVFGRGHLEVLGGDFVSVNYNCLDDLDLCDVNVTYWDGRNDRWQAGARSTPWPTRPETEGSPARAPDALHS